MNKTKHWFFGKINKIDKALTRLVSIRNDRGVISKDSTDNKRITEEYSSNFMPINFKQR